MQTGKRWFRLIVCTMLAAAYSRAGNPENTGPADLMKKRLESLEQQVAGAERFAKEAGDDAGITAALQKRDTAIQAMKAHLEKMIAAQAGGDEETFKTLREQDPVLGRDLERANRSIEFARRAAKQRRELDEIKRRKAEHPDTDTGDTEAVLSELAALYDGIAANPPEGGKGLDDATAQKIAALESKREQVYANAEFQAMKAKIQRQVEETGGNEAVKIAGDKLLDVLARTRDARTAISEARAREQAVQQERMNLDMAFREASAQARKEAHEAAKQAKEQPKDKPAEKPAE